MNPRSQLIVAIVIAFIVGMLIGRRSPTQVAQPAVVPAGSSSTTMMDHSGMAMNASSSAPMATSSAMDMSSMMHGMMMGLEGKTGDAFDRAFLDEMIVHHQGAVDMAKSVLTSSNRPELKAFANDIITAQTKEVQQMQTWRSQW